MTQETTSTKKYNSYIYKIIEDTKENISSSIIFFVFFALANFFIWVSFFNKSNEHNIAAHLVESTLEEYQISIPVVSCYAFFIFFVWLNPFRKIEIIQRFFDIASKKLPDYFFAAASVGGGTMFGLILAIMVRNFFGYASSDEIKLMNYIGNNLVYYIFLSFLLGVFGRTTIIYFLDVSKEAIERYKANRRDNPKK